MIRKKTNNGGFTLVELLIAISLIGILTGVLLAVINPRGIQAKARDSQRISDLAKVKVALESYFSDNRAYPVRTSWVLVDADIPLVSALVSDYINVLPKDPMQSGTDCNTVGWRNYFYKSDVTGSQYVLVANMEKSAGQACPVAGICDGTSACAEPTTAYYTTAD